MWIYVNPNLHSIKYKWIATQQEYLHSMPKKMCEKSNIAFFILVLLPAITFAFQLYQLYIFGNFVLIADLKLKIFAPVNGTDMQGPYQQFFKVEQKKE